MIELTQAQLDIITKLEKQTVIDRIKAELLAKHAELIPSPSSLNERLIAAYDYLQTLNFQDNYLIQSYLSLVAFNPDFQHASPIKSALESPGQKPEQQFKDILCIAKNKINRRR
ncbi:hypothetical protein [Photorhabdus heterorhabditis]|uniref:hypothetical protein n=1 Tax=Photorhabdus heterorhabditis TaxID=880156 RepID=UPI0015623115|nr:hypothetical protein [Photorhabdus heterorhabditis]NRN29096.1 hypothetical protein [Photorhabdus heterorhabditis subsp. aluminescens]